MVRIGCKLGQIGTKPVVIPAAPFFWHGELKISIGQFSCQVPFPDIPGFVSGAIETIFTVMMMNRNTIIPTINFERDDSYCDLDYVPNQPMFDYSVNIAVKTAFGFGGNNSVLVIKRID